MGFETVTSLDCDTTISLGGKNKKTGKVNPTSVEGYYLGAKQVADAKRKSGISYIYIFNTKNGNVGVWGKTNLDNKMKSVTPGLLTRVTQSGMQNTPNGEMYLFKVEVDKANSIDVTDLVAAASAEGDTGENTGDIDSYAAEEEETALDADEVALDEVKPTRASAPRAPAQAPDAARQAKVQALLKGARRTA